jgi:exopolyphosphatase/pppGpp-phosphohydrolase
VIDQPDLHLAGVHDLLGELILVTVPHRHLNPGLFLERADQCLRGLLVLPVVQDQPVSRGVTTAARAARRHGRRQHPGSNGHADHPPRLAAAG